jgi:hypothetical protein
MTNVDYIECSGLQSDDGEDIIKITDTIQYKALETSTREIKTTKCTKCNKFFNKNYLRYQHTCEDIIPLEYRPVKRHTKKQNKEDQPTTQIIDITPPKIELKTAPTPTQNKQYTTKATLYKKDISKLLKNMV